jgi:hypothetical protein
VSFTTRQGKGEAEDGSHFSRLIIPLPFVPLPRGEGEFYFLRNYQLSYFNEI